MGSLWLTIHSSFASARKIRYCTGCRTTLEKAFGLPQYWWSQYCQNSNGYFGCDEKTDSAGIPSLSKHISGSPALHTYSASR